MSKIVILGAGESGAGAAVLAKKEGFEVFVSDMSKIKDNYKKLMDDHNIEWEEGHHTEEKILDADEVIKSPGIPKEAPMVQKLMAKGTPIISEIEFAGRYTDAKMICITGSNGKTTTTSLIYHIIKSAGYDVGLAGNIGKSLALQVAETPHKYYVIELSSFQLDNMYEFRANMSLRGKHNIYNSLAAGLACNIVGIDHETLHKGLSDFPGVEHRLEKVGKFQGVYYVNDSKATNVDACWYALESMTTPTILIIGGKDKGNDYNQIKDLVKEKCAGIVYLGADNQKLHDNFDALGIPVRDTHSMKDCVAACQELAKPGYTVLLSPCCASFDLFKNMEDRGEQFKALARAIGE